MPNIPKQKPYTEEKFKQDADKFIKGYLGGFDQGEMNQFLKNSVDKIEASGVMSSDEAKDFIKERASYLREFAKDNPGETLPKLKEESKKTGDPFLDKLMFLPNTLDKIAEKIAPMLGYADGGRIGFLEGGDTAYNAMVFRMYTEAGGQEGTGMDIDSFAEKYFPKMAQGGRIGYSEGSDDYFDEQKTNVKGKKTTGPVKGGKTPEIPPEEFQKYLKYKKNKVVKAATGGRIGYNQGSMDPDTLALKEKIEEIMDIEGVGFGEAFKQAMRELASQSKEND